MPFVHDTISIKMTDSVFQVVQVIEVSDNRGCTHVHTYMYTYVRNIVYNAYHLCMCFYVLVYVHTYVRMYNTYCVYVRMYILSAGETKTLDFTFQPGSFPLDLYFLMDLGPMMETHFSSFRDNIGNMGLF